MKTLLLIPAFNEERMVRTVVEQAKHFVADILVVDDGSTDRTCREASAAGAIVQCMGKNRGKGEALKAGFGYALSHGYDFVITMDGDAQHDATDIAHFFPLLDHNDLVLGSRSKDRNRVPTLRRIANFVSSLAVSALSGRRIIDSQTGFRAYSSKLLRDVRLHCSHYDLETEVIIKAARQGFRINHCTIRTIYAGEVSRFRNLADSMRFLKVIAKALWPIEKRKPF